MRKLALIIALLPLLIPGLAQSRNNCLRVMPVNELTRNAILIARVKVFRTEKARYKGLFNQLATLRPVDVIEGDFTLTEINVLARSNERCAEDNYIKDQEMLVFLEPEDSLFHTVNFQYGQFLIVGDIVKGWRDKANNAVDKPYAEVRQEITDYVKAARTPKTEGEPKPPAPQKPPAQPVKPPAIP
ncbi:MAG TPA: hypothetical protein VNN73_08830 [Blastocatellia bacterium]|nr:hypothetical protein [Blastocatellia bacterium]